MLLPGVRAGPGSGAMAQPREARGGMLQVPAGESGQRGVIPLAKVTVAKFLGHLYTLQNCKPQLAQHIAAICSDGSMQQILRAQKQGAALHSHISFGGR